MRVGADSRPVVARELPADTLSIFYSLAALPRLPPRLSPLLFAPDHGIISLKAHGGEGTTKEERLPYEATVYVLTPSKPLARSISLSHPRRYRGARARCVLSLYPPRARSILSVCLSYNLSPFSSSRRLSRARDLSRSSCAFAAPLARYVRACSVVASTRLEDESLVPLFARSLATIVVVVIVVRTSAHSNRWRESGQEKRTGRKHHVETSGDTGARYVPLVISPSDPARAGSNYGELTYLLQMGGSRSFGRANPLLREASGIVKPDKGAML